LSLSDKEKACWSLRHGAVKNIDGQISQELSAYQLYVKDITTHMKAIAGELNMHHAQITDYKDDIHRSFHEIDEVKRKYFDQKRRNQLYSDAHNRSKAAK